MAAARKKPAVDHEAIATEFFGRWSASFDEVCASLEETFAEDCEWDQRPMARTHGIPAALKFMRRSRRMLGLETIDVDVLKIASTGDTVLCERVDHLRRRNGNLIVSAPVVGVLQFDGDGKIVHWREYFDSIDILRAAVVTGVSAVRSRVLRGKRGKSGLEA